MVDPEFEVNRQIKLLTNKRKKTTEDFEEIGRLEWLGGIYTAEVDGRMCVTQPCSKVRKCLINAAKITKQGKQIERAIVMTQSNVPLIYDGSEKRPELSAELDRLISNPVFHSRLSVGVGKNRVMRVRPQFSTWALVVPAMFVPDAGLNFHELQGIVSLAGIAERIGDNRVNGYGSFIGIVREVTEKTKPVDLTFAGVDKFVSMYEKGKAA